MGFIFGHTGFEWVLLGMEQEARAANVLDRLDDCQNGVNVNESDVLGSTTSDAFLKACKTLVNQVVHASHILPNKDEVVSVARSLARIASSSEEVSAGDVNASLMRLATAIDGEDVSGSRIEAIEKVLSFVQASRIVAWRSGTAANATDSRALRELQANAEIGGEFDSAVTLLKKVQEVADKAVRQLPDGFLEPLVRKEDLNGDQLDTLGEVGELLAKQYTIQRQVLIERARLTLESFLWSKRLESLGTTDEVKQIVDRGISDMFPEPNVRIPQLFLTSIGDVADVAHRSTCGHSTTFKASVKGVVIGEVPDRGGRPDQRSDFNGMPQFSKRIAQDHGRGGRGGRRGGKRGGRHGGKKSFDESDHQHDQQGMEGHNGNHSREGSGDQSQARRGSGRIQGGWQSGQGSRSGRKRGKHNKGKYR